ncbi:MAG: hypothetical protein IH969_00060, partial [Candidatus Krumholzibacteriota bacterium]|nr:hypothetical protein [Candidatus Krumholzibacteriota bacterium]
MALSFLPLAAMAALGLSSLIRRLTSIKGLLVASAVALALLAEATTSPPLTPFQPDGPATQVNRLLADREPGLVVELPWSDCPALDCLFTEPPRMVWSRYDWFPRLGGYSSFIPPWWPEAHQALRTFPDEKAFRYLGQVEAKYVILRVSAGPRGSSFAPEEAAALARTLESNPMV